MADSNEPKKETVRITLPPPAAKPPDASNESRETVRINLPARLPSTPSALASRPGAGATRRELRSACEHSRSREIAGLSAESAFRAFTEPEERDRADRAAAGSDQIGTDGRDEKNSAADHDAGDRSQKRSAHRGARSGQDYRCNSKATLLGRAWCFRCDFDYSNLELLFVKPWKIPQPSLSMNPPSTAK